MRHRFTHLLMLTLYASVQWLSYCHGVHWHPLGVGTHAVDTQTVEQTHVASAACAHHGHHHAADRQQTGGGSHDHGLAHDHRGPHGADGHQHHAPGAPCDHSHGDDCAVCRHLALAAVATTHVQLATYALMLINAPDEQAVRPPHPLSLGFQSRGPPAC